MLPECAADVAVSVALGDGVALVVFRFAAAKTQLQASSARPSGSFQRHKRVALPGNKPVQLADFALVHQQLFRAHGVTVEDVALVVGAVCIPSTQISPPRSAPTTPSGSRVPAGCF